MYGMVALHVSAWIEIRVISDPLVVYSVALHVSAWIEIANFFASSFVIFVALHVSAWIEIYPSYHTYKFVRSHSM